MNVNVRNFLEEDRNEAWELARAIPDFKTEGSDGEDNKECQLEEDIHSEGLNPVSNSDTLDKVFLSKFDLHIDECLDAIVNKELSAKESEAASLSSIQKKKHADKLEELNLIKNLAEGMKHWTVKARVEQKSSITKFKLGSNSNTVFSLQLRDTSNDRICVCFYGKFCEQFYSKVKEGTLYKVSGGKIRPVSKPYHGKFHSYFILVDESTEFVECFENSNTIPEPSNVSSKLNSDINTIRKLPLGTYFDIVSTVNEVKALQVRVRFDGESIFFREVILSDATGNTIKLCLWEDSAKYFTYQPGNNIALKNIRLKSYNSEIFLEFNKNSSITECITNNIIKASPLLIQDKPAQPTYSSQPNSKKPIDKKIKFSKLKDLKETSGQGYVKAQIICYNSEHDFYYPACGACSKKLSNYVIEWRCSCGFSTEKPNYKYLIHLLLDDGESNGWVQVFEPAAVKLMGGLTAKELQALSTLEEIQKKCRTLKLKTFVFQIKAKQYLFKERNLDLLHVKEVIDNLE